MPDARSAGPDTVHVIVGWSHEYDSLFLYEARRGDAESDPAAFEVDVPKPLWDDLVAARRACDEAELSVVEAAGFDLASSRMASCCPEWEGHEGPGRNWFSLVMPASEAVDEWPCHDVTVSLADTSEEADAQVAGLPDEFYVYNGATQLLLVRRDRLQVEPGGFRPAVSGCYRCGWRRDEHPSAGDGGG